jgi:hypothetical protein
MAKKRAMVDATLTVTAASDIFTQDVEDMPEEIINSETIDKTIHEPNSEQKPTIKDPLTQATDKQIGMIHKICETKHFNYDYIKKILNVEHGTQLNKGTAGKLIEFLQKVDEYNSKEILYLVGIDYLFKVS